MNLIALSYPFDSTIRSASGTPVVPGNTVLFGLTPANLVQDTLLVMILAVLVFIALVQLKILSNAVPVQYRDVPAVPDLTFTEKRKRFTEVALGKETKSTETPPDK